MTFIKVNNLVILISLISLPCKLLAAEVMANTYPPQNQFSQSVMPYNNPYNQVPTPQLIRDPFTPSNLMYSVVGTQSGGGALGTYGFMRSPNNSKLPTMRLRGFVEQKDSDNSVALLEVAGSRTYLVREGDEINIDPSIPNSAIRISKITRLSVTVEAGTLGSIRIQR